MGLRKRFRGFINWCPHPSDRLSTKLKTSSMNIAAVCALTLILSSSLVFSLNIMMMRPQLSSMPLTSWPMFRGNSSHNGAQTGSLVAPVLLWSSSIHDGELAGGESSPAVANGVLYVGSADGNLYALNATTGANLWNYSTNGAVDSSPAVIDGAVYFGSLGGNVDALNASNGSLLWSYDIGPVYSSPDVINGVVYIAADSTVYAFNALNGVKLWNNTISSAYWAIESSPAVANGVLFIGSNNHNLYALNATNGKQLWAYTTGLWVQSSPVVSNGVVYVESDDGNLYALNAATGQKLWSSGIATSASVDSLPALANNIIYILSNNDSVCALTAKAGVQLWSSNISECQPDPIVVGNILYIGGDNNIYALNDTNGNLLWTYSNTGLINSSPTYANGVVYVDSTDGNVYAFGSLSGPSSTALSSSASTNNLFMVTAVAVAASIVVIGVVIFFRKRLFHIVSIETL